MINFAAIFPRRIQDKEREGIKEGIKHRLSEAEMVLFQKIQDQPGLRIPQLADILEVAPKTLEKQITRLRKWNIIELRGSKKTGGYWVKERSVNTVSE